MATGTLTVSGDGTNVADCYLQSSSTKMQHELLELNNSPVSGVYSLAGATSLPTGGTIDLACSDNYSVSDGFPPPVFYDNNLVVTQVGGLN
jgi:hypothetical protein